MEPNSSAANPHRKRNDIRSDHHTSLNYEVTQSVLFQYQLLTRKVQESYQELSSFCCNQARFLCKLCMYIKCIFLDLVFHQPSQFDCENPEVRNRKGRQFGGLRI